MIVPQSDWRLQLDAGLRGTSRELQLARLRRGAVDTLEHLLGWGLIGAAVGGGAVLGVRFWHWQALVPLGCGSVTVLVMLAVAAWRLVPTLLSNVSLAEAAERLDLAANCGNRIATAEELSRTDQTTAFEAAAIADGLRQLGEVRHCRALLPAARLRLGRDAAWVVATALLILVPLLLPRAATLPTAPSDVRLAMATDGPVVSSEHPTPPEKNERLPQKGDGHPAPLAATPVARPGDNPLRSAIKAAAAQSESAEGGAAPVAGAAAGGQAERNKNAFVDPSTDSTPPGLGVVAQADALRPKQATPPSGGDNEQPSRVKKNGGGTWKKSAPAPAGNSKGPPDPSGGASSGGGSTPPPPDAPPPQGDSGTGSGPEMDKPSPDSSGSSSTPASSNNANGDGKTTGQSQPKKSRGVAPLLLGTRQPDLFQGRPLPGPDERTKLLLPPTRNPGQPAARADAPPRSGDERPVHAYQVPADLRDVAGQYFQQFHADADAADEPTPRP